jgi:hypothetical protein
LDGSASILTIGKRPRECGISGCVIALGSDAVVRIEDSSALHLVDGAQDAGIMALIDPS